MNRQRECIQYANKAVRIVSFFRTLLSPDYRATILWSAFWVLYLVYFIYGLINPL